MDLEGQRKRIRLVSAATAPAGPAIVSFLAPQAPSTPAAQGQAPSHIYLTFVTRRGRDCCALMQWLLSRSFQTCSLSLGQPTKPSASMP